MDQSPQTPTPVKKNRDEVDEFFFGVARSAAGFEDVLRKTEPQISTTQWALLRILRSDGEHRPVEVAKRIGTSRQLVLQASRKLERLGMLETSPPKEGQKAVILRISDNGKDYLEKVGKFFDEFAELINVARPALKLEGPNRVLGQVSLVLGKDLSHKPAANTPRPDRKPALPRFCEAFQAALARSAAAFS